MTPREALGQAIRRLRRPEWACADTYLLLCPEYNGWSKAWLIGPTEQPAIGIEVGTQSFYLGSIIDEDGYEPYAGPIWHGER